MSLRCSWVTVKTSHAVTLQYRQFPLSVMRVLEVVKDAEYLHDFDSSQVLIMPRR